MTRGESDLFLDYSLREAEKLREATAPLASRMRLSGMPVHLYSKNKWGITSETMKK